MNLPSFTDFARDPGAAWCAQHAEYAAMARECLSAARGSYGIARKVHLRSARHYGKLARMTLQAASQNFPQGTAMERGVHPGHEKRRTGNSIKAGHFFFFGGLGLWIKAAKTVASALMTLPTTVGSMFIGKNQGCMSKAALLVLPLFLTGCDFEFEETFPATVTDLAGLDPWVAVALVLRGPLYCVGIAVMMKGFVLVKVTHKGNHTEIQRADEEDEA